MGDEWTNKESIDILAEANRRAMLDKEFLIETVRYTALSKPEQAKHRQKFREIVQKVKRERAEGNGRSS